MTRALDNKLTESNKWVIFAPSLLEEPLELIHSSLLTVFSPIYYSFCGMPREQASKWF